MNNRLVTSLLALILGLSSLGGFSQELFGSEGHVEVSMRMIGHQVLLSAGDSTSLVMPIEKENGQYTIRFNTEFGFDPETIGGIIDGVILATDISDNYIVEFVSCDSQEIVHSYEMSDSGNVLACRGRVQPVSCYDLRITMLDYQVSETTDSANGLLLSKGDSGNSDLGKDNSMTFYFFILALNLAILIFFFVWRKKARAKKKPHLIQLGGFQFDTRNMELLMHDQRIELTSKESDLLQLLSASANNTVEREDILKMVWGDSGDYVGRTLDVFISKLRKKLESDSTVKILNIRGVGYKLVLNDPE